MITRILHAWTTEAKADVFENPHRWPRCIDVTWRRPGYAGVTHTRTAGRRGGAKSLLSTGSTLALYIR